MSETRAAYLTDDARYLEAFFRAVPAEDYLVQKNGRVPALFFTCDYCRGAGCLCCDQPTTRPTPLGEGEE